MIKYVVLFVTVDCECHMIAPILFAAFGAFAFQLLGLLELKNVVPAERPDLRDPLYWLPFFVSPTIAAFLALAYVETGIEMKPLLAVNVGVAAPAILRSMAELTKSSPINPGRVN